MVRNDFLVRLTALADMVQNFELTKELVAMYDQMLSPLGYESVCVALEEIMSERSSRDPFPSIKEIKGRMSAELDPDQEATLLANRIIARIGLDGRTNPMRAREKLGETGWRVVEAWGGWDSLCNVEMAHLPSARAQLEKLSKAVLAQKQLPASEPTKLLGVDDRSTPSAPRSFGGLLAEIEERKTK